MTKASIGLQDLRRRIYVKAKAEPSWRFWGLYVHVCKRETLRESYRMVKKNNGAPGIDGVTFDAIEGRGVEVFLGELRTELISGQYRPMGNRKREIPKDGGKVRVLSIPSIRDRVVQGCLKLILEPIFESDFQDGSYGYRPKRTAHQAVQRVSEAVLMGLTRVVDLDLRSYFDTVSHSIILRKVAKRVNDAKVMRLLKLILKASGKRGVPQGGVISPLLSNIYLHEVLDVWFEQEVRPRLRGMAALIRFADDYVILCTSERDAHRIGAVLAKRFGKHGLSIHEEKTRLLNFYRPSGGGRKSETFVFLGFTHYWGLSRKGNWVVKRKTAKKKLKAAIRRVYQWCKHHRHDPVKEQWSALGKKLIGHYQFYGITCNWRSLNSFYVAVKRSWRKWLDRRSRGKDMPWERFQRLLARYPLPRPRITHRYA